MSSQLLPDLAVIESMLVDFQMEHAQELENNPELQTSVSMAYRQVYNARLRHEKTIDQAKIPARQVDDLKIKLTRPEKWVLQNLATRRTGIPANMLRAEHDRLIANKLIEDVGGLVVITERGAAVIAGMVKGPRANQEAPAASK